MNILDFLQTAPGATYVAGSGGKTSLIASLAQQLPGTCVLTTTTHIYPFDAALCLGDASLDQVAQALTSHRVVCVGAPTPKGKLTEPSCGVEALTLLADYVLVEADGSKHLPLKAHASWEPSIPPNASSRLLVVGALGFGQPICQAVHRPEIFCQLTGASPHQAATPKLVARALATESLADTLLINQVNPQNPDTLTQARRCADALFAAGFEGRVAACSLKDRWIQKL